MEELTHKQIIGLPVFTVGGTFIGQISELVINPKTQSIAQYLVKPKHPLEKLFNKPKLISVNQVLSISKEKMVVDDLVVATTEGILETCNP